MPIRPSLLLVLLLAACGDRASRSGDTAAPLPVIVSAPAGRPAAARDAAVSGFALEAHEEVSSTAAAPPAAPLPTPSPPSPQVPLPGQEALATPMLVRVGQATVRVDSLGAGMAHVRDLARRAGGMVANTTVHAGREERPSATLELRVPGERFDELVNGLSTLGRVESMSVNVQDVGEEYTDVAARVANARRLEQRLLEVLARSTGRLADILAVERELARVREEIERYEGRLRYLRTRVAYSSLSVTVHEPLSIVAGAPGRGPIAEAFRDAWRNFVGVVAGLIAFTGILVPVGALALGAWLLLRRWRVAVAVRR